MELVSEYSKKLKRKSSKKSRNPSREYFKPDPFMTEFPYILPMDSSKGLTDDFLNHPLKFWVAGVKLSNKFAERNLKEISRAFPEELDESIPTKVAIEYSKGILRKLLELPKELENKYQKSWPSNFQKKN